MTSCPELQENKKQKSACVIAFTVSSPKVCEVAKIWGSINWTNALSCSSEVEESCSCFPCASSGLPPLQWPEAFGIFQAAIQLRWFWEASFTMNRRASFPSTRSFIKVKFTRSIKGENNNGVISILVIPVFLVLGPSHIYSQWELNIFLNVVRARQRFFLGEGKQDCLAAARVHCWSYVRLLSCFILHNTYK